MNDGDSDSGFSKNKINTKTFLLVDDEPAILDCISMLLEAQGNKVLVAGSVAAATQLMKKEAEEIDCLIIDYSMPETNGLQLMNQFRSIGWKHPTIICSDLLIDIQSHPDVQYWPEYVLAKPYGADRLQEAIVAAIGS